MKIHTAFLLICGLLAFLNLQAGSLNAQTLATDPDGLELTAEEVEIVPTEEGDGEPIVEGTMKGSVIKRQLNAESRLNPDNTILDLNETRQTIEATVSVSDYLDQDEAWRWLFKTYGYQLYESENSSTTDDDLMRIEELYLDWKSTALFASLGKRRISWGPALAFNPVNVVVPPRDPLNPDQQTEGQPMFLVNLVYESIVLDLILTRDYDRDWFSRYSRWGARFAIILEESDFNFFYFDGEANQEDVPYSRMAGISFSSNLFADSTLYLEAASFSENERNYYQSDGNLIAKDEMVYKAVIGSNTILDGNTSLLVEIYHNSAGYTEAERQNYWKTVDAVVSPVFNQTKAFVLSDYDFAELNRNYFLISYRQSDILDRMEVVLQLLGAEDGSAINEVELSYNLTDYYQFMLKLRHASGDEESEFGNATVRTQAELSLSASF